MPEYSLGIRILCAIAVTAIGVGLVVQAGVNARLGQALGKSKMIQHVHAGALCACEYCGFCKQVSFP